MVLEGLQSTAYRASSRQSQLAIQTKRMGPREATPLGKTFERKRLDLTTAGLANGFFWIVSAIRRVPHLILREQIDIGIRALAVERVSQEADEYSRARDGHSQSSTSPIPTSA